MNNVKSFLLLSFFLITISVVAQNDCIFGTSAFYSENMAYNDGEIFVIFNISSGSKDATPELEEQLTDLQNEETVKQISLYPNPTADYVYILPGKDVVVNEVYLYNLEGRLLVTQKVLSPINLTNFPQGTYILKTDFDNTSFKIIRR